jgi:hypothetical protein
VRALVNAAVDPGSVQPPDREATTFHRALPGYRPTPLHDMPGLASEVGLGHVAIKDESDRLGLPAFKVLGASWAVERALRERPVTSRLVAASAGNHGRAVAHVASSTPRRRSGPWRWARVGPGLRRAGHGARACGRAPTGPSRCSATP